MALSKSEIKIELREISLKDRPDSLYKISPKGTVPVLQISENEIIDESLQIMLWAIEQSNLDWLDSDPENQMDIIKKNDVDFKYWLNRYKYSDRFPEMPIDEYQDNCKKILSIYDNILIDKEYLFSDKYQLSDIALFPLIRQCENVNPDWFSSHFTNLSTWLYNIKSSNLFLSVMNKYEIWNEKESGLIIRF